MAPLPLSTALHIDSTDVSKFVHLSSDEKRNISGKIAGIVIGSTIGGVLLIYLLIYCMVHYPCKCRANKAKTTYVVQSPLPLLTTLQNSAQFSASPVSAIQDPSPEKTMEPAEPLPLYMPSTKPEDSTTIIPPPPAYISNSNGMV